MQLIVNQLWEQPTERVEECIVAKLPAPSFVLPRTKKCPVPRPLTKWEKFALEKGIKKTKKDKKVFDEELDVRNPTESMHRIVFNCFDQFPLFSLICYFIEMGSNVWI